MNATFVVWAREGRIAQQLAEQLGARLHFIRWRGGPLPVRYAIQLAITWWRLLRERPSVVIVQSPPIVAVVAAYLYARLFGARLAIFAHSASFLDREWRWALPVHRAISRRAAVTIVHNEAIAERVRAWGAPVAVTAYIPGEITAGAAPYRLDGARFHVAVISTRAADEPLEVILKAATRLPDVQFHITGRAETTPVCIPANCQLTGYLPYEQYYALLRDADAVMDLTTRDETMLMGGLEAVALGTPLITSNWPVLGEYFRSGALHVENDVVGIVVGVQRARHDRDELRSGVQRLRCRLSAEWEQTLAELHARLSLPRAAAAS